MLSISDLDGRASGEHFLKDHGLLVKSEQSFKHVILKVLPKCSSTTKYQSRQSFALLFFPEVIFLFHSLS